MTDFFQKNLFKNISLDEYKHLISCMEGRIKTFRPDETICCYDSGSQEIGIIGRGRASVVRFEYNGARTILEQLVPQSIFGSMLSYESSDQTGVSVICDTECDVLFIKYDHICASCANACAFHHQLTRNLIDLISCRARDLSRRVEVLSQRTIRDKLMCFFSQQAVHFGSSAFQLPFTMVDLADYLSIDRSAMTRELKKMKDEKLVEIDRKSIRLLV